MNGKVYLIGAGPGDYGLITLKGMQLIETADVLVYDKLINKNLIYASPSHCEKIYVGKQAANHAMPQDQINEVLYQKAKEGKTVVRLKGGDPYVFGRGGEEGIYLVERNIPIEVVPGITSSIAGPCYAGIPVTHRDWASSFHVFTGNFKDEIRGLNFANLAELEGTLLFLMGFGNLNYITQGLIKAGKNKDTPVAVISKATTPQQHTVTGTLETIEQICKDEKMVPPAITLVG
ncbi:MAG: uroporphyrinogen-III C-methyltransferase, partial [Clostridiales bacterium]